MNEEQASEIIDLLKAILDKMPEKTAYDLHDLHSELSSISSSVSGLDRAIDAVRAAVENIDR